MIKTHLYKNEINSSNLYNFLKDILKGCNYYYEFINDESYILYNDDYKFNINRSHFTYCLPKVDMFFYVNYSYINMISLYLDINEKPYLEFRLSDNSMIVLKENDFLKFIDVDKIKSTYLDY